jgi:adenine-specific DNA-methyltransferase
VQRAVDSMMHGQSNGRVIDYFAGSGTTGHAIINLNRGDQGEWNRRFILVEMGVYFNTVLKPRIAKVLYSPEWKNGKAQLHGKGTSALVKYFALESYEDALNNLPAPTGGLLAGADSATKDAMITYSLDLELGPNLLNLDVFRDPWGYTISAQPAGEAEIRKHPVDLVETFNYLLGLKVKAYGPIERYTAEFERAEHADNLGRLKVAGRLRRDQAGPFVFQRVEGELLDGTRVLVVWRTLSADAEQDAATLETWMSRHREETKERSEHRDYHQIYINGPVTLPQPTAEIRTVLPIEQTFKDRMFADTNGVQHG